MVYQRDLNAGFFRAVDAGDVEAVKRFVKDGAQWWAQNPETNYADAMQAAVKKGHVGVVDLLLDYGYKIDGVSKWNGIPLHIAILSHQIAVAARLLDRGADIHHRDDRHWDALLYAINDKDPEAVTLLVNRGANINRADECITQWELGKKNDYSAIVAHFNAEACRRHEQLKQDAIDQLCRTAQQGVAAPLTVRTPLRLARRS